MLENRVWVSDITKVVKNIKQILHSEHAKHLLDLHHDHDVFIYVSVVYISIKRTINIKLAKVVN